MKKVSWDIITEDFDTKTIHGELLGFVSGWFFTYAVVNPLEDCYESFWWFIWKNHPKKIRLSKIRIES
jgi:hypothetical protein